MRNKAEQPREFHVSRQDVIDGQSQDTRACTMACALKRLGLADVKLSYDIIEGAVNATWEVEEIDPATGDHRIRIFNANVEPLKEAVQILAGTDVDKKRLLRILPESGWDLQLSHMQSRWKQRTHAPTPGYVRPKPGASRRKPRRTTSRMFAVTSD